MFFLFFYRNKGINERIFFQIMVERVRASLLSFEGRIRILEYFFNEVLALEDSELLLSCSPSLEKSIEHCDTPWRAPP